MTWSKEQPMLSEPINLIDVEYARVGQKSLLLDLLPAYLSKRTAVCIAGTPYLVTSPR
jgi:hypothetical protein